VDHTARSNHRLSRNSALKKADSLRHFLLKKVAKNGFLHIIEKPIEMNRPTMKSTSPTDGGDVGSALDVPDQRAGTRGVFITPYPSHHFGTGSWPFFSA